MALYHYTTETRYKEILKSQQLRPSMDTQHDAAAGVGWYFTDLGPSTCEKTLMNNCWEKDTLYQRVKYYLEVQVTGALTRWVRDHVYFVPLSPRVSFQIVSHGEVPECSLKPCHLCPINPEKR